jgi:hypothetical protein
MFRPQRSCLLFLLTFIVPFIHQMVTGNGCALWGGVRAHKTQSRPIRSFLAVRLFYNCSQIMLALEAILGMPLVMNHILYLILILFSLLSWIHWQHQQILCAWHCLRCWKYLEKSRATWSKLINSLEPAPRKSSLRRTLVLLLCSHLVFLVSEDPKFLSGKSKFLKCLEWGSKVALGLHRFIIT